MPSKREQVLAALFVRLRAELSATVRRNEALPERVPPEGLVILRDGDQGEPDVTLDPRTDFYQHRVELEVLVTRASDGSGEARLDQLIEDVAAALAIGRRSAAWRRTSVSGRRRPAPWRPRLPHRY